MNSRYVNGVATTSVHIARVQQIPSAFFSRLLSSLAIPLPRKLATLHGSAADHAMERPSVVVRSPSTLRSNCQRHSRYSDAASPITSDRPDPVAKLCSKREARATPTAQTCRQSKLGTSTTYKTKRGYTKDCLQQTRKCSVY